MAAETPKRPPGGKNTLFLFDGYNFIFRAYHAIPMLNAPDGTPTNAVQGFARMVQAARRDFGPQALLAVFDAGGDGGRKAAYAGYKAQRPPPPEDLVPQFRLVRQAVDALNLPRVEHPEFEADDVIASYVGASRAAGMTTVIVSSDKDLMQLVTLGEDDGGPPVVLYDTMKDVVIGPAEVREKFGVLPEKLGDLLALTGDSSDNVPGVPGIGPKTAAALLGEYETLEGVLAAAPDIKQKKRRERLVEHADDARLSRQLVELRRDVELPRPLGELDDPGFDEEKLLAFFEPLGFKQLIREMGRTPSGGAAELEGEPGALELVPIKTDPPDVTTFETWTGSDADGLSGLADSLRAAGNVAVYLINATPEGAGQTEAALGARPCGVAVAAAGVPPKYLAFGHAQADLVEGPQLPEDAVWATLKPLLEDPEVALSVHHHKDAAHALANLDITLRGVTFDPMLASYSLDPARSSHELDALTKDVLSHGLTPAESVTGKGRKAKPFDALGPGEVGTWACERVWAVQALHAALAPQIEAADEQARALLADVEMPLCGVLSRIERRGIRIDTDVLGAQGKELETKLAEIQGNLAEESDAPVNLDSPLQLQKLLFEDWGLPPSRKIKTGYSTDASALEKLSQLDPRVKYIQQYRQLSKLKNTYVDALPRLVREGTGRLHTTFAQAVAATGRLSSIDPNLQNIPIRTAEGRRIRDAFVASDGQVLVAIDYSQIELRVLAHLSGDPNLRSAFLDDVDVHRRTAAEVFGVSEDEVDDEQRRIAKAVNFGVVYGQTAFGLAEQLAIPRGKAGIYIRGYMEKIPGVDRYMRELIAIAKRRGYATTILGRRRRIPELSRKGAARAHGERIARNTPIQGSAADIMKVAMIAVEHALASVDWARVLLTVHDELIFECDEARVDELVGLCRPLMEGAVGLEVPLRVDAGSGPTWGACKG